LALWSASERTRAAVEAQWSRTMRPTPLRSENIAIIDNDVATSLKVREPSTMMACRIEAQASRGRKAAELARRRTLVASPGSCSMMPCKRATSKSGSATCSSTRRATSENGRNPSRSANAAAKLAAAWALTARASSSANHNSSSGVSAILLEPVGGVIANLGQG
jgi:hypothetical protein